MNPTGSLRPRLGLGYIKKDDKSYYLPVTTQLFGDYFIKPWNNKDPYEKLNKPGCFLGIF